MLGAIVAGCGGDEGDGGPKRSSATTSPPPARATTGETADDGNAQPLPTAPGPLDPGRYEATAFVPKLSFELGEGWALAGPESPRFLALVRDNALLLAFARPVRVVDPAGEHTDPQLPDDALEPVPEDMIEWLAEHPRLHATAVTATSVGGVEGRRVDTLVRDGYAWPGCPRRCVLFFATAPDFLAYSAEGDLLRNIEVEVQGESVLVAAIAAEDRFKSLVGEAERVLATVEFTGS